MILLSNHLNTILLKPMVMLLPIVLVIVIGVVLIILIGNSYSKGETKELRNEASNLLFDLQLSINHLHESIRFLQQYPHYADPNELEILSNNPSHARFLSITKGSIIGDSTVNGVAMKKDALKALIKEIKNTQPGITLVKESYTTLTLQIKDLKTIEEKYLTTEEFLPKLKTTIAHIEVTNSYWWHQTVSVASFTGITRCQNEVTDSIKHNQNVLQGSGSIQDKVLHITEGNRELKDKFKRYEKACQDFVTLEQVIEKYQTDFLYNLEEIQRLSNDIRQWQQQYPQVNQSSELDKVVANEQRMHDLHKTDKKDWETIIHHSRSIIDKLTQISKHFIDFDKARKAHEIKFLPQINQLDQSISEWFAKPDYADLPGAMELAQKIQAFRQNLDQLIKDTDKTFWLEVKKEALNLIDEQKHLTGRFEAYEAAHQKFKDLKAKAQKLHEGIKRLNQTVKMSKHPSIGIIKQKQADLYAAIGWFAKVTVAQEVVDTAQHYMDELTRAKKKLHNQSNACKEAIKEAELLLYRSNISPASRQLINNLKTPGFEGKEYDVAINQLNTALQDVKQVVNVVTTQIEQTEWEIKMAHQTQVRVNNNVYQNGYNKGYQNGHRNNDNSWFFTDDNEDNNSSYYEDNSSSYSDYGSDGGSSDGGGGDGGGCDGGD